MMRTGIFCLAILLCSGCCQAQTDLPATPTGNTATHAFATVQGVVVDPTGAAVPRATISLQSSTSAFSTTVETDSTGVFSIVQLPAGAYSVAVSATNFDTERLQLHLMDGQALNLGQIALKLAAATSTVQVTPASAAAAELKADEQQRLLGAIPNFLVTYRHDAPPLSAKQKYELSLRLVADPATFAVTGIIAGIEQADNAYADYGQGARGFGRRYGAAYGNFFIGSVLSSAVLPSLLKQDPRYFVQGQGPAKSRVLYALANSVVRKGDNGHWQPDYSGILGNLGAGAISNAYLPSTNRSGAATTFQNAGIGIAANAAANLLQEFVFRRITPKAQGRSAPTP